MSAEEQSEFGSGIVVCLAKFSEHLANSQYERLSHAIWWHEANESKRNQQLDEAARFPRGDAANRIKDAKSVFMGVRATPEEEISSAIEMWMNGASDHMYEIDRDIAPAALVALSDLTLRIGHGFTGERWTKETVTEIRRLWQEACLAVDERLGVVADWGQW